MKVRKESIRLLASPAAVIALYLKLHGNDRIFNIVQRVRELDEAAAETMYKKVLKDFAGRHRHIEEIFSDHFNEIQTQYPDLEKFSHTRKLLLGSIFTKEYSIEAAALFNPSIVPHPDQENLKSSEQRFILSLRATGEGHISSIVFRTGTLTVEGEIRLDASSGYHSRLKKSEKTIYSRLFIAERANAVNGFDESLLEKLPGSFTALEAIRILKSAGSGAESEFSVRVIEKILDSNYDLDDTSIPINEKVIFPTAKAEHMGMEDVRFVRFSDKQNVTYYGTYTAYDGHSINTQLIETNDFQSFKIRTLYGAAISDKGMALFPEKINDMYVMIGRQGGEKMSLMHSPDLYRWENFEVLTEPQFPWELVQSGNCGSPVKTEKGWLLFTHGVGPVRTYVISAVLLDLNDPSKIIGRLKTPLLEADEAEREGYVPNVVYTCGSLVHGGKLIIPYAVSDAATQFASVSIDELLNEMTNTSDYEKGNQ